MLDSGFKEKIHHLYNNLYTILSENYEDNEIISVDFHIEKSLGFGRHTRICDALINDIRSNKFGDLVNDKYSLKYTISKDGGELLNEFEFREFVTSITFYMVMFNAVALIGDKNAGYSLFASQRRIYYNNYIVGLYAKDNINAHLNRKGINIYSLWKDNWNSDEHDQEVWRYQDCWPIYLLDDARELINYFEARYKIDIQPLV